MSFGSGLNMESKSPLYIKEVAASVAYAHSKNISIGGETTTATTAASLCCRRLLVAVVLV